MKRLIFTLLIAIISVGMTSFVYAVGHVVISEIQIADNEFVKLYNPTDEDVDMSGWYWSYFSSTRNWNDPYRNKEFPSGANISADGFYLIGLYGYPTPIADWQPYDTKQLSDYNGSVGIFSSNPSSLTPGNAQAACIDAVAWGSVDHVKEKKEAKVPGESLERKWNLDGTIKDTDDNSDDFVNTGAASGNGIKPKCVDGNPKCEDLTDCSCTSSFKPQPEPPPTGNYTDGTINISITSDGTYFNWLSDLGVCCVIVKGGPNANVFVYNDLSRDDTQLHTPVNPNNDKYYDISHITFCYDTTTPVQLASFNAVPTKDGVRLLWHTGSEVDSVGFNLYCREGADGELVKINEQLIPASGGLTGTEYEYIYTDKSTTKGKKFLYYLEEIDISGNSEMFSPVEIDNSIPRKKVAVTWALIKAGAK